MSDGSLAFDVTYPVTGGAGTDVVFGAAATDRAAVANTGATGYVNSAFSASTRATGEISFSAGATLNLNTATTIAFE